MSEQFESPKINNQQKIESIAPEKKELIVKRGFWGEILKRKFNQFKEAIGMADAPEQKEQLEDKRNKEIDFYEKEAIIDGVNFFRCQINEIVDDYKKGKKVEFETFSPYLSDYNTATGEIWRDKLIPSDKIGLSIGKTIRNIFPKARLISLYDEYNSLMPDADFYGEHIDDQTTRQIEFSAEAKGNFKNNVEQLLRENDVIRKDDKENENYLFVSESSKIKDAEELVKRLELSGNIKREGEKIIFVNSTPENSEYSKIVLRKENGWWQCPALDASSYIKPENLDITHLVILPNYFIKQQDQVWEILRVLGIKPDRYLNVFYDEKLEPEKAAEIIKKEFSKYF